MDVVELDAISQLAFQGVPDTPRLRSLYWKLLLRYLPPERAKWQETMTSKRAKYDAIKQYATSLDAPRPVAPESPVSQIMKAVEEKAKEEREKKTESKKRK